jgi:chemotaxis protein MotB
VADKDDGPPPTPDWIVTFTDLMSLLLTFFILLLTFSTPKVEKLFELRGSLKGSFGVFVPKRDDRDSDQQPRPVLLGRDMKNPHAPSVPPRHLPLEERDPNAQLLVRKDALTGNPDITWENIQDGQRLRLASALQFAAGREKLTSSSFARLDHIAKALAHAPYQLIIEAGVGTRDLSPTVDPAGLSEQRAIHVAQRLQEMADIDPSRIGVAVRGEVQEGPGTVAVIVVQRRRWERQHGG